MYAGCQRLITKNIAHIVIHRDMLFKCDLDDNRRRTLASSDTVFNSNRLLTINPAPTFTVTPPNPSLSPFRAVLLVPHSHSNFCPSKLPGEGSHRPSAPSTNRRHPTTTHPPNHPGHSAFGSEWWLATRFTTIHHPSVLSVAVCGAIMCCSSERNQY